MGRVDHWWRVWSGGEEDDDLSPGGGQIGVEGGHCSSNEGDLGGEEDYDSPK